ncbi:MAG: methyltransferase domain-containing protein [Actinobacteria bacterium]|nr:methyltransferase domain-containing protein [Actinomycetota bacterium]
MTDTTPLDVILGDDYLRAMYDTTYGHIAEHVAVSPGPVLEVGAGQGVARELGHQWWLSDISDNCRIDVRASALGLPCRDHSLAAIVLKDTWHHIADIETFLAEASRVLMPAGRVVVVDPYWGMLARFVYRYLHQERWDAKTPTWHFSSRDPWDSNQALSYLMLRRDRALFEQRWGQHFEITEHSRTIGPSFLFSGGVSRRTPVSGALLKRLLQWEENRGTWFDHLRFFHVFSLRKRAT